MAIDADSASAEGVLERKLVEADKMEAAGSDSLARSGQPRVRWVYVRSGDEEPVTFWLWDSEADWAATLVRSGPELQEYVVPTLAGPERADGEVVPSGHAPKRAPRTEVAMRESAATLPAAVALAVAAPLLVGVAVVPPPAPVQPIATGSLIVRHTEDSLWPTAATDLRLRIRALGAVPSSANLTSSSGQLSVSVRPESGSQCDALTALATGAGDDEWCVLLSNLPVGGEVVGTLKGASSSVALTVSSRPRFFLVPFLAAFFGFALAVLVTFLASPLADVVKTARLRRLAAENAAGEVAGRIVGLSGWVETRLAAGADADLLMVQVQGLVAGAPTAAHAARTGLSDALNTAGALSADHPLRALATREAMRQDQSVTDFVDVAGDDVVHPATSQAHLLAETVAAIAALDEVDLRISTSLNQNCQSGPALQVLWARDAVTSVTDQVGLARLQEAVNDARSALREMLSRPSCVAAGQPLAASGLAQSRPMPPIPHPLTGTAPRPSLRGPLLTTALVVVALVVVAMASVAVGIYQGKPAFGTGWDYLATALAGFGSGSAATVAATLGYWRLTGVPRGRSG